MNASAEPEKQTQSNPTCSELVESISKGMYYSSAFRKSLYTSQIRSFLVISLIVSS